MSSSHSSSSPINPFKSKKLLQTTPKPKTPNPFITTQTPEKQPTQLPPRLRNRRVALSVKEVRKIAQSSRDDGPSHPNRTDQIVKSARRQIASWPDESTAQGHKSDSAVPDGLTKIPDKYEMLGEFFDNLDSSIRLLRLKGSMSSFTNICPKIQSLTDRRFSYGHLAQLKYVLPEAIEINRVLKFDERTSCMKPDLHITINADAIECDGKLKSESKNIYLRKVFRERLVDFYKAHPEGDDIPEEMLPEPFHRSTKDLSSDTTKTPSLSSSAEASTDAHTDQSLNPSLLLKNELLEEQQPAVASHLPGSFRRHFSHKLLNIEAEKTHQKFPKVCLQKSTFMIPEPCLNNISSNVETSSSTPFSTKVSSKPTNGEKCSEFCASSDGVPMPCLPATPSKEIGSLNSRDDSPTKMSAFQSTPAKLTSIPASPMSTTPALNPSKRCYMSPDDDCTSLPIKLTRRPPKTRSLQFDTPVKNAEGELNKMEDAAVDDDILKILPASLLESVGGYLLHDRNVLDEQYALIREKERKAKEERDPAISQAKRRRQMIACLPKLFNMIHFLFQSIKQSVITKEELIHKIIASHSDIVDRREVEEQLHLLLELVPEWISEKSTSSGDLLFRINRMSSPETIRARLEEAK